MGKRDNLVVGLDIGTTKVCAIVGEAFEDGLSIIGIGSHPSKGLHKGVVVNIESTVDSIRKAVEEAELMANCEISSVYAGIAGGHIKSFNSHGMVAVKDREITERDVQRVIDAAQAVAIPMDREVIHSLPQEFIIDGQDGIRQPIGMNGVRLEAWVHLVTGVVTSAQNIIKCANKAGLDVADIVLQPLASSEAVLSEDEKELGVALLDIGGGTTDLAIFREGSMKHSYVLALGGNHITNDIAAGLRTPAADAERIKKLYGCACSRVCAADERVQVPSVGGRSPRELSRKTLVDIIEPRMEEIFSLVREEIVRSGVERREIPAGIVLTGGTSNLEGIPELAEEVFELPARRGIPENVGGLQDIVGNPMYATGVGLVIYGSRERASSRFRIRDQRNIFGKVKARMQEWFSDLF
ncbi:MAG: cell division protein FtsA [Deltaproteobacteria bacterium RBG_13_65_10]|nr:MAG: cell division protein FtsA [Deltaproteobacteria bacterium RBG_13_65_10]